jgi:4-methoxybenzoate monooxygenase (O-demethylating)
MTATNVPPNCPRSDLDIFCMDAILHPDNYDVVLREMAPVVYLPQYDMYVTGRHEHSQKILANDDQFSAYKRPFFEPASVRADILITDDRPKHPRVRRVIQRAMSPAVMRRMKEEFAAEAERLVEELMSGGTIELEGRRDLVGKYVLKVFPDIIGLPAEGRHNLLDYGDVVFNTFGPENQLYKDTFAKAGPVLEWVVQACQKENVAAGLIAAQMYDAVATGEVDEHEAMLLVLSILSAGSDSTIVSLMNTLAAFAKFPAQWQHLRANPQLMRTALEESLRYESITRFLGRGVITDFDIEGVTVPADAKIGALMYAAGRDPRRWENPETFDLTRQIVGHIGFGVGIHACVGQSVARLEAECLFGALSKRVKNIDVIGEAKPIINNIAHGTFELPLRLHAV